MTHLNRRDFNKGALLGALSFALPQLPSQPAEDPKQINLPYGLPALPLPSYNLIVAVDYGTNHLLASKLLEGARNLTHGILNHFRRQTGNHRATGLAIHFQPTKSSDDFLKEIHRGNMAHVQVYQAKFKEPAWWSKPDDKMRLDIPFNMMIYASNVFVVDQARWVGWSGYILKSRLASQYEESSLHLPYNQWVHRRFKFRKYGSEYE